VCTSDADCKLNVVVFVLCVDASRCCAKTRQFHPALVSGRRQTFVISFDFKINSNVIISQIVRKDSNSVIPFDFQINFNVIIAISIEYKFSR
jgi:hypothetical protein